MPRPIAAFDANNPLPPIPRGNIELALVDPIQLPTSGPNAVNRIQQLVTAGDDSGRLYSVDTRGEILVIENGVVLATPFLDLNAFASGFAENGAEAGLRSLAFHPDFANVGTAGYGKVYTVYSASVESRENGVRLFRAPGDDVFHDVLTEWTVLDPANPLSVDPASQREILRIEEPFSNHNANQLAFNPNAKPGDADYGQLYFGIGDGGAGGDPFGLAQNLGNIHGKIVRIDPLEQTNGDAYGIPDDNPFVGRAGLDEVFAYGFRNPQTLAFDTRGAGRLFVGDIGQNQVEEIDVVVAGGNYGWDRREGGFVYNDDGSIGPLPASDGNFQYPIAQYDHEEFGGSAAIAGGFVYRGTAIPELRGKYLFSDFPSGRVFYVNAGPRLERALADGVIDADEALRVRELTLFQNGQEVSLLDIASNGSGRVDLRFGQDDDGELYLFAKQSGTIWSLDGIG
jgi:hypothetical protein